MYIREYRPEDDPALLALERQSPRGVRKPFVHFRRRFIDRAALYRNPLLLVAVADNRIVGASGIAVKGSHLAGEPAKIAYSFDTRVLPDYRRQGIGHAMVEQKLDWAREQGAIGVYSLIVATNHASLGMLAKSGYEKTRQILYLNFYPYPDLSFHTERTKPECIEEPCDQDRVRQHFVERDLFVPCLATRLDDLGYQRWRVESERLGYAGLSVYDQAQVYIQIPAEGPWPETDEDIAALGRNLQIFDGVGMRNPRAMEVVFNALRDEAVTSNVNNLTWLIDRADPVPNFLFQSAAHQKDYWLMFKSFVGDMPEWSRCVYLDPRDL